MPLITATIVVVLIYVLQKVIYAKTWSKGLGASCRFSRDFIDCGESAELRLVVENAKYLPLPIFQLKFSVEKSLEFEDMVNAAITDKYYKSEVFALMSNQRVTRKLSFIGAARGVVTISDMSMIVHDFLMSSAFAATIGDSDTIYVFPRKMVDMRFDMFFRGIVGNIETRRSLIEDRLTGVIMPKYVIPFKHDKHSAREIYTKWAKKGILTPRMLYSSSTIEKITGIYVPFWLYDYDSITDLTARCTTVTRRVSGNTETTTTKYYDVTRQMKNQFDRVPADASIKMDDDKMDKLEPFDYSNLTDFEMPYLSGFYSEKYDYTSDDMKNRIEKRIADYALNETRNTIHGYSSVSIVSKNIRLKRLRADYALLPVWELYYTYNGKQYSFLMNGQTGKIVADRPVSKTKAIVIGVITYIAAFILFMILGGLFG